MGKYNRCKLIPCKQCWRSLQEGVSVPQTQKTFNHTFGGKKADFFPARTPTFSTQPRKRCHTKSPLHNGCVQALGLNVQKESQRVGSCHGLVLFSAKVLYFMQRKLKSFPAPAKLDKTQVGLMQQLWIPPKLRLTGFSL